MGWLALLDALAHQPGRAERGFNVLTGRRLVGGRDVAECGLQAAGGIEMERIRPDPRNRQGQKDRG